MKKNIIIAAAAALVLTFTACQKEDLANLGNTTPVVPTNSNNGNDAPISTPRVKSTSDLHNTNWTYTVTYTEFLDNIGIDTTCMSGIENDTMSFDLNFDGTYAHFSFPNNIMAFGGDEGMLEQIYGVSYSYTYNGATHTGYLDGVTDDNDSTQLEFTYNDATDIITFVLNLFYADDETPVTLTLNFARNE